ncbi:hypothetical protein [Nonomuraea recticatena]|uniref:DUF3040 domain-containing protein n=1 Tax=Nonomuraea recticatena TaxID=46178 RepID=A0ABN3T302_9ACTN
MYFDQDERVAEPEPDLAARRQRIQRDIAGVTLLLIGALFTVVAAFAWEPIVGLALTGGYLIAAGGILASGRTS